MNFIFLPVLALVLVMLNSCGVSSDVRSSGDTSLVGVQQLEKRVALAVDRERAKKGYKKLAIDARISALARKHSGYLGKKAEKKGRSELNHDGFNRRQNVILLDYAMVRIGENVAYLGSSKGVPEIRFTDMWMASSKHYKNMMQEWSYTGVGVYQTADGAIFATQIFALKKDFTF